VCVCVNVYVCVCVCVSMCSCDSSKIYVRGQLFVDVISACPISYLEYLMAPNLTCDQFENSGNNQGFIRYLRYICCSVCECVCVCRLSSLPWVCLKSRASVCWCENDYVCACACVWVCVCVCLCVCIRTCVRVCMNVYACAWECVYMYVCVCVFVCGCVCVLCTFVTVYVCVWKLVLYVFKKKKKPYTHAHMFSLATPHPP